MPARLPLAHPATPRRLRLLLLAAACATVLGCASTKVQTSGRALRAPLCEPSKPKLSALVLWGPRWRADQKEPQLREASALRGIVEFFDSTGCLSDVDVRRYADDSAAPVPTDEQLLRTAADAKPQPDRVVLVVVRELGPRLEFGIPTIMEGSTEVVLDIRVLDAKSATMLADVRTKWRNGGTFVVRGVGSLDHDMSSALRAALMAPVDP